MSGTILVTGAGGFVGSAVVRQLVTVVQGTPSLLPGDDPPGHVVALLRPGGPHDRLQELSGRGSWSAEYADLTDRQQTRRLVERLRPRAVVHCAISRAAYHTASDLERHELSCGILEVLFDGLAGMQGSRFIHTSSAWVLAAPRSDNGTSPDPFWSYARTKALEEEALPALHRRTGVPWISLRLFNLFGKYEPSFRLLPYLVSTLAAGRPAHLTDGTQIRDFTDVEVAARAYLLALQAPDAAYQVVYDIGSGQGTTVRDFAMTVASVTGNAHLIRFGGARTPDQRVPVLVASPRRAQEVLRWAPPADLSVHVARSVRWWLQRSTAGVVTP